MSALQMDPKIPVPPMQQASLPENDPVSQATLDLQRALIPWLVDPA
jgi:hypothetical protein